jgi:magnesium-transporting ATPase (P-type)
VENHRGPTEGALKVLAAKIPLPPLDTEMRSKIPFDSQYKYMSTLYRLGDEEVILITGAPDVLFRLCQFSRRMTDCSRSISLTGKGRLKSMPVKGCAWWLRPGNLPATGNASWIIRICRMA